MAYLDEKGLDTLWDNALAHFGSRLRVFQDSENTKISILTESDESLHTVSLPLVTQELPGLMNSEDKLKLDGIAESATANIGTITSVSTNSPLSGEGESGDVILSHETSEVVPGDYGNLSEIPEAPNFGDTFEIPGYTVDSYGHIVFSTNHEVTIPSSIVSQNNPGLMSILDKLKLDEIDSGATRNVAGAGISISSLGEIKNTGVRYVEPGNVNGTINVDINGDVKTVKVHGLESAAYRPESYFATAAQGQKADNAVLQSEKGIRGGVASLDQSGLVPAAQLPSYVDDVREYPSESDFPGEGESGVIYVAQDTNKTYRYYSDETTSHYIEISKSLGLGNTSSTAFPGDRGQQLVDIVSTYGSAATRNYSEEVGNNLDLPTSQAVRKYVAETAGGSVEPITEEEIDDICK